MEAGRRRFKAGRHSELVLGSGTSAELKEEGAPPAAAKRLRADASRNRDKLLAAAAQMPENTLRTAGAVAMAAGFVIVWLTRG